MKREQLYEISSICMAHILKVNKMLFYLCNILGLFTNIFSKFPSSLQKYLLNFPGVKSLNHLILVISAMQVLRLMIDGEIE